MKIKSIWYAPAILFLLAACAHAQEASSVADTVAKMEKELNLTQQQAAAVKPIMEEIMAKREEFTQNAREETAIIDSAAMQNRIEQLDREEDQRLSQVLTPEQMNKWIQKQKVRNAFNRDRMNNARWMNKDQGHAVGIDF